MLIRRLLIGTVLLSLNSCGSVPIKDPQFCSPIPFVGGATCDNLMTRNQINLSEIEWKDKMTEWGTTDCTASVNVADLKAELEKLCSKASCTVEEKQAIKGLGKISNLNKVKSYPIEVTQ